MGGCLLHGGVCSWGEGAWCGGVWSWVCVCVSAPGGGGGMHWGRPPCEQNSWHTLLKILPCPKLRLRAVTTVCTRKWWHIWMLHQDWDFLWQIHWSQWANTRCRAKTMSYVPNSDPTNIFHAKSWICAVTTRNYMNEQSFPRTIALCKRTTAKHQGSGARPCAGLSLLKVKESLIL